MRDECQRTTVPNKSDFANTPIGLQGWDAIVLNCGSKAHEAS